MEFTARQIADFLAGDIDGDPMVCVHNFSKIESGTPGTLSFLSNPKYENYLYTSKASIILVNKDFTPTQSYTSTLIRVENAYESLARLMKLTEQTKSVSTGISSLAAISASAKIGVDVVIYPFVFVGDDVVIGDHVTIYPGACIYRNTIIGDRCIIHANVVIGSDGFGYAPGEDGIYTKIPQIGNVILEDDVEIGSGTTIDRATLGSTIIRKGTKIDNLVQIGHNVEVGENTVIASQTGISGSSVVGKGVKMGGQVGVAGHLHIADGTILGAKAGVPNNITEPGLTWSGHPLMKIDNFRRSYVIIRHLPELNKTVNEMEKKIKALEKLVSEFTNASGKDPMKQ